MITTIYLIRHTQTVGNVEKRLTSREDYDITENGYKYINLLTEKLKHIKFDKAFSSTYERCKKTIKDLAKVNNLEIVQNDNLCEMYFGIYDGMKWEDVNKKNPLIHENHIKTNEIMGIENQESTQEVAIRMYNYIKKIARENEGKTLLVCSHGVAIEAFLRRITGDNFLKKIEEYSQKNTSINIIKYDIEKDTFKIELLNDISHLHQKKDG